MTELCVDASLAAKMALKNERLRSYASQLFADSAAAGGELIAPPIFVSEVDSIVCRREFSAELNSAEALTAFQRLDDLDISIIDLPGVRKRAREITREYGQERVYDSTYAALAEIRGCDFWTADHAFYKSVKDNLLFVHYLAEYPLP